MAIADLGQEHGVAVLLADMDVFAGLMEGHCLCFFFFSSSSSVNNLSNRDLVTSSWDERTRRGLGDYIRSPRCR